MKIELIRHGQVPGNIESRYVGTTDESLTEEGIRQAEEMTGKGGDKPAVVYVSPMFRCRQTADILFPHVTQVVIPELRECDFGEFEYKNYMELDGNPNYQAWIDSGGTIGFPGGEDRETFCRRTVQGFQQVMEDVSTKGIDHAAVVAHGGTIMAILQEYGIPRGEYYHWQCKNLQGYILEIINNKVKNLEKI